MSASLYAVTDPSTGDVVKEYPTATDEQIEVAIAAASKAHREWSRNSTVAERAALIRKVAELHTERKRRARQDHPTRDGQAARPVPGRGRLQRGDLRVLRRQRREVPRRRAHRAARRRGLGADPAQLGRRAARDHAVELPLLPGRPVRRPEPDAGQHHRPQARTAVPRVGRRDSADLHRRRLSRGRLRQRLCHQRADRRRSSPTHGCKGFR